MYRLQFHNNPQRVLYMFKYSGNTIVDDSGEYTWNDLKGQFSPVNLKFDEVDENGIFTPIIKTSLNVSFVRTKESDFNDIIEADDNDWMAVVVENGELEFDSSYNLTLSSGATLVFKGTSTMETYSEDYVPFASVNLTFHDRLGELTDLEYEPINPQVSITAMLAELLRTTYPSGYLYMEFPYNVMTLEWRHLKNPKNLLLDVTKHNNETKSATLSDFLYAFGLRLFCDFTVNPIGSDNLSDWGVIKIVMVKQHYIPYIYFYHYQLSSDELSDFTEYSYDELDMNSSSGYGEAIVESKELIKFNGDPVKIINQSGSFQLTRRAKYIEATSDYELRENILYPESFEEEDFEFNTQDDRYDLQYKYWYWYETGNAYISAKVKQMMLGNATLPKAWATRVGDSMLLALLIRNNDNYAMMGIITSSVLCIKDGTSTFTVEVSTYSTESTRNIYVILCALYQGTLYQYSTAVSPNAWIVEEQELGYGLRGQPAYATYETFTFTDIPQLDVAAEGDNYQLCAHVVTGNTVEWSDTYTFITALKIVMVNGQFYPSKLTETTTISDTRRKPVEIEPKFYNLPDVDGKTAIYASGMLATGLDRFEDNEVIEESSDIVIAPPVLEYGGTIDEHPGSGGLIDLGNNATLLVHLSDMYGINHLYDRWQFDAKITKKNNDTIPAAETFLLTITIIGDGTVTKSLELEEYYYGDEVQLLGVPDSGEWFIRWSYVEDGSTIIDTDSSGGGELTLIIKSDIDVVAYFSALLINEEFTSWQGTFPEAYPTGWSVVVYNGSGPDSSIYVDSYSTVGMIMQKTASTAGIHVIKDLDTSITEGTIAISFDVYSIYLEYGQQVYVILFQYNSDGVTRIYLDSQAFTTTGVHEFTYTLQEGEVLDGVSVTFGTTSLAATANVVVDSLQVRLVG